MKKLLLFASFILSCCSWMSAQNGVDGGQDLQNKLDAVPGVEAAASEAPEIGYMTNDFGYSGNINKRYYFSVPILNASIYDLEYEWKSPAAGPEDVEIIPDNNGAIVTFKKRGNYQIYVRVSYPGSTKFSSASSNVSISY